MNCQRHDKHSSFFCTQLLVRELIIISPSQGFRASSVSGSAHAQLISILNLPPSDPQRSLPPQLVSPIALTMSDDDDFMQESDPEQ